MNIRHPLTSNEILELQQLVSVWYLKNQRSFPWRETRDPYHLVIAEKLLQQTSAGERVIDAYHGIITLFPNFHFLSNAKTEVLAGLIAQLGLYYRATELIKLASVIESQYHGVLPQDYLQLLALPGIGEYTARAILSFAYNQNIPIIDTNIARFLFRVFNIESPFPKNPARKKYLVGLATSILPEKNCRDFNFALLDLCAAICKAQNPLCKKCPINRICYTGCQNLPEN